jgi:hypothetical protein
MYFKQRIATHTTDYYQTTMDGKNHKYNANLQEGSVTKNGIHNTT